MFEVRITHDAVTGRVDSIEFSGAEFSCSNNGQVRVWLDDEAGMNWHRLHTEVEQEQAAASGDFDMRPFREEAGREAD